MNVIHKYVGRSNYAMHREWGNIPGCIGTADGVTNTETMQRLFLKQAGIDPDYSAEEWCATVQAYLDREIDYKTMFRLYTDRKHGQLDQTLRWFRNRKAA